MDTRIEKLKRAFEHKDYAKFFKLFPDTYNEFIDFYAYDEKSGAKPLYDGYDHIIFLFDVPKKHLTSLINKSVNIAVEAKWDADAVNYFQDGLSNLIIKHPEEVLESLNSKSNKEVTGFWHFIFDGSGKYDLQNKEKFTTIYKKISVLDKNQGRLLKEEFEKMYK